MLCIGKGAFENCKSLQSIDIPKSVTQIEEGAFSGCNALLSLDLPNSVTSIGEYAFSCCLSLVSIDIIQSVRSIGKWAFSGCHSLKQLHCRNEEPASILAEMLFGDPEDADDASHFESCTLFVPAGTRWEYRHHNEFGKFKLIELER